MPGAGVRHVLSSPQQPVDFTRCRRPGNTNTTPSENCRLAPSPQHTGNAERRFVADQCLRAKDWRNIRADSPSGDSPMFRVTLVVWIVLGTALAGCALLAVLIVPDLAAQAMRNIPRAVLTGFAVAIPLSYLVARKIDSPQVR
jgi:hypothetical protein